MNLKSTENLLEHLPSEPPEVAPDVPPEAPPELAREVESSPALELLAGLEQSLSQLRSWQEEQDRQNLELLEKFTTLAAQKQKLEVRRQRITRARKAIEQRRSSLNTDAGRAAELLSDLHARQQAFLEREREQKKAAAQVSEQLLAVQGLRHELDQDRLQLAQQQEAMTAQVRAIESQRLELTQQGQELESLRAELQAQRAEFQARRDQLAQVPAVEPESPVQTIAEVPADVEVPAASLTLVPEEMQARFDDLQKREAELEQKQATYREAVRKAREQLETEQKELDDKHEAVKQQALKYNAKFEDLRNAYVTFKTRRKRLHRYRTILRTQSKAVREAQEKIASLHQQYAGLLQQRQTVLEVKQFLAQSEERMVHKWATHGSVAMSAGLFIALALAAIFSHAIGQQAIEPVWQARGVLDIKAVDDQPNTGEAFVNAERKLLLDDPMLRETVSLMAQRGVRGLSEPELLKAVLQRDLTLGSPAPGKLEMVLRSKDKDQMLGVLEAMGRARISYQMMQDRQAGRENSVKIAQAPTRDETPVQDGRLKLSAQIFVGLVVGLGLLIAAMRWWLLRAKRVFDAQHHDGLKELEGEEHWPNMAKEMESTRF